MIFNSVFSTNYFKSSLFSFPEELYNLKAHCRFIQYFTDEKCKIFLMLVQLMTKNSSADISGSRCDEGTSMLKGQPCRTRVRLEKHLLSTVVGTRNQKVSLE